MNTQTLELIDLLRNQKDLGDLGTGCVNALSEESMVLESTVVPLNNVRNIYQRRAMINEEEGGQVRGYEQLIPSLKREKESPVTIHIIETSTTWWLVFTDPTTTRLIGVLSSPKATKAI